MQLQLPIFPKGTRLVSDDLGVYEHDELIQYIVNGLPVYSHDKDDLNSFRYITSNFIHQGICRKVDIQRCFGISEDSVGRAYKKFVKEGANGFFGDDARKGRPYKIVGELRQSIQKKLDKGQSVNSIAKESKVRESAIRYGIKQGYLKKK
jgi:predicted DNA-binding transcriptional regulator